MVPVSAPVSQEYNAWPEACKTGTTAGGREHARIPAGAVKIKIPRVVDNATKGHIVYDFMNVRRWF